MITLNAPMTEPSGWTAPLETADAVEEAKTWLRVIFSDGTEDYYNLTEQHDCETLQRDLQDAIEHGQTWTAQLDLSAD